jgi:hypothetical protein
MEFTKQQKQFLKHLEGVINSELDLETSIMFHDERIEDDYKETRKKRKEFFDWFNQQIKCQSKSVKKK